MAIGFLEKNDGSEKHGQGINPESYRRLLVGPGGEEGVPLLLERQGGALRCRGLGRTGSKFQKIGRQGCSLLGFPQKRPRRRKVPPPNKTYPVCSFGQTCSAFKMWQMQEKVLGASQNGALLLGASREPSRTPAILGTVSLQNTYPRMCPVCILAALCVGFFCKAALCQ